MGMISKIGKSLPDVVRGDVNLLDVLTKDDLFLRFHQSTFGIDPYLKELGRIAGLVSNRYPHINILEIGKYLSTSSQQDQLLILDCRDRNGRSNTAYFRRDWIGFHFLHLL